MKKGQKYKDVETGGTYEIIKIEKFEGDIEDIILQNVNNKSLSFGVCVWELKQYYKLCQ